MKKLFLLVILFPLVLSAQDFPNSIRINSVSSTYLPADIVNVNIQITHSESEPKLAISEHKKLDEELLNILVNYDISDSDIVYSPFTITRIENGNDIQFRTQQNTLVNLRSLKKYLDFQIALLDSGFKTFWASFKVDYTKELREEQYRNAYKQAVENAETIAKSMDKKLGDVIEITTRINEPTAATSRASRGDILYFDKSGLSEIGGTSDKISKLIRVSTHIDVRFEILD